MAEYTPENTPSTEGAPSDNKNKGIKFTKNIVSNQEVVDKMDLGFSELAESSVPVDEESILNDYDNVFYNMKVSGDHSHKALVNKIYDHVNYAWVTNMDRKIISRLKIIKNCRDNSSTSKDNDIIKIIKITQGLAKTKPICIVPN